MILFESASTSFYVEIPRPCSFYNLYIIRVCVILLSLKPIQPATATGALTRLESLVGSPRLWKALNYGFTCRRLITQFLSRLFERGIALLFDFSVHPWYFIYLVPCISKVIPLCATWEGAGWKEPTKFDTRYLCKSSCVCVSMSMCDCLVCVFVTC